MEIFYPADNLAAINQMLVFFCWAFAARLGWRYADFMIRKLGELRQVLRRKKDEP